MNRYFRQCLVACVVLAATMILTGGARGQAPAPLLDMSKITDAKVKTALEEISAKQAAIKELIVEEMKTTSKNAKGAVAQEMLAKILTRQPNLFYQYEQWTVGVLESKETWTINDGKILWQINQDGPKWIDLMTASMKRKNAAQAEIDKQVAEFKKVHVYRIDLEKMKEAGLLEQFLTMDRIFLNPLSMADPATLKLSGETPTEWTFTANFRNDSNQKSQSPVIGLTGTFNKTHGLCVKWESSYPTGSVTIVTLDKITVNPQPALDDVYFSYQPPEGAVIKETTDNVIASLKKSQRGL